MDGFSTVKPQIIHIDDDGDFLELFSLMMGEYFDITSTRDGRLGINLIKNGSFGAAVVDYRLSSISGLEILKILKKDCPELPVIIYTGQGSEETARNAFLLGASDYFAKNFFEFSHREILADSILNIIKNKTRQDEDPEEECCRLKYHTTAMEASMDGIAILDSDEKYFYLNSAHAEIYGYESPKELLGKTWRVLYNESELLRFEREIFPILQKQGRWRGEALGMKKDGTLFDQEVSLTALETGGLVCVVRNIEQRRIVENQLKYERDINRNYFDTAGVMMMVLTPEGKIKMINRKGIELLGSSDGKNLAGLDWFDEFIPEENRRLLKEQFMAEVAGQKSPPPYQEISLLTVQGEERIVSFFNNNIITDKGEVTAVICSAEDITVRRRIEKELIDRNRELNDFVYMVSHDLKNPVNIIKGFITAINDNRDLFDRYFDRIINQSDTLITFIDNLLKLSRAGRVIGAKQQIDLENIIRQAYIISKPADVNAVLSFKSPPPPVEGDPERISQVFSNLIGNAVRYRDNAKNLIEIRISHRIRGKMIEITLEDNGSGINPESAAKIFEAGFTLRSNKGTGFGLPIVKKIIEAHQGSIRAESEGPGMGSRFIIRFPFQNLTQSA